MPIPLTPKANSLSRKPWKATELFQRRLSTQKFFSSSGDSDSETPQKRMCFSSQFKKRTLHAMPKKNQIVVKYNCAQLLTQRKPRIVIASITNLVNVAPCTHCVGFVAKTRGLRLGGRTEIGPIDIRPPPIAASISSSQSCCMMWIPLQNIVE